MRIDEERLRELEAEERERLRIRHALETSEPPRRDSSASTLRWVIIIGIVLFALGIVKCQAEVTPTIEDAAAAVYRGPVADFATPGKAAYCRFLVIRDHVRTEKPLLNCWRTSDGFTITVPVAGRPTKGLSRESRWVFPAYHRVLHFEQTWWVNAAGGTGTGVGRGEVLFRCISRRDSLTCESRTRNGFSMGRARGHRIF